MFTVQVQVVGGGAEAEADPAVALHRLRPGVLHRQGKYTSPFISCVIFYS